LTLLTLAASNAVLTSLGEILDLVSSFAAGPELVEWEFRVSIVFFGALVCDLAV
jgi:hypothetical protein